MSIAEDPRIAFLQSNLFWQVSCAKSKTKACTEISARTKPLGPFCVMFLFVCDVSLCFVTFSDGALGQVRYWILSIPDLCLL